MDMISEKTKAGTVVRWIFSSEEEWKELIGYVNSIIDDLKILNESCRNDDQGFGYYEAAIEDFQEMADLFANKTKPCDPYQDGKPCLTLFPNQMLAVSFWLYICILLLHETVLIKQYLKEVYRQYN